MCLAEGAVTAQAPAGQGAAGKVALRLTVAIATTPDLGAARTLIPPTNGRVPQRNPAKLSTMAGTHVVQVLLYFNLQRLFVSSLSHLKGVNSVDRGRDTSLPSIFVRVNLLAGFISTPHLGMTPCINDVCSLSSII